MASCSTLPPLASGGSAGFEEHVQKREGNESQIGAELPGAERLWLRDLHVALLLDDL